jgi:hypothetical protein
MHSSSSSPACLHCHSMSVYTMKGSHLLLLRGGCCARAEHWPWHLLQLSSRVICRGSCVHLHLQAATAAAAATAAEGVCSES